MTLNVKNVTWYIEYKTKFDQKNRFLKGHLLNTLRAYNRLHPEFPTEAIAINRAKFAGMASAKDKARARIRKEEKFRAGTTAGIEALANAKPNASELKELDTAVAIMKNAMANAESAIKETKIRSGATSQDELFERNEPMPENRGGRGSTEPIEKEGMDTQRIVIIAGIALLVLVGGYFILRKKKK
jgi:LPXTG-motif cell wall-anchored protein